MRVPGARTTTGKKWGVRLSQENVLVITLNQAAAAQALKTLRRLDSDDGFELRAAAIVHRTRDGQIRIKEHASDVETRQTLVERHPRLATLLTVLAGPLDTQLLGNSLVALAGAVAEPTPDELALEHLARVIPLEGTAIIADVIERDPDVVNRGLAPFGARVTRRPLAEVYAEVGAANEAITAAGTEARRVLRNTRPTQQ